MRTVRAVWRDNRDISSPEVCFDHIYHVFVTPRHSLCSVLCCMWYKVLGKILQEAGFPADKLLHQASTESVKSQLFANTSR